jgi:RNA polymerase II subunit A small phosphatase-like protein
MGIQMIIILDLDSTLIHAVEDLDIPGDFTILGRFSVKKRPHLDEFISFITSSPHYEVAIWSAAIDPYVREIVDNIFPNPSVLKFVASRDFCEEYRKPISKAVALYNSMYHTRYDVSNFVIIDDRQNITRDYELNHILIKEYNGDNPHDRELLSLKAFLHRNTGVSSECLVVNW